MLGATTVQVCTSVMWHGYDHFQTLLKGLSDYMNQEGLDSLDSIRERLCPTS